MNPPLATAAIGVVEPRRSGAASGINSTFRQVGTAVGVSRASALDPFQGKLFATHLGVADFASQAGRAGLHRRPSHELLIVGPPWWPSPEPCSRSR